MRTAAKRDTPERAIIAAAESLGAVVLQVSGVGLPDTLVLHKGRVYLVEVKRQGKPLTDAQDKTFKRITASRPALGRPARSRPHHGLGRGCVRGGDA